MPNVNVLENVNEETLKNQSEEDLRNMLLAAHEQLERAKKNNSGGKEVEVIMGEYTPPKADKPLPMVRILNDGRPFAMGVKGVRRILESREHIEALQSDAEENPEIARAIEALGGSFYKANKVLTYRERVHALLEEQGF